MIRDVRLAGKGDGNDLLRLIVVKRLQHCTMEVLDVDGSAAGFGSGVLGGTFGQSGLLGDIGDPKRPERAGRAFVRSCQLGSCARIAVADVGSGGRRRNRIAGALQSVQ